VKVDEDLLSKLTQEVAVKRANLTKLEKQRGKIFTDVAPKITETAKGAVTRTYNKRNAEMAYDKLASATELTIADLAEASKAMKQSAMDKLAELTIPQIILGEIEKPIFENLHLQQEVVLEILQKSATSSAVERLRKNPALAAWVESGRELHAHSEDGKCEYCLQKIPEERETELAAHFNASDAKLKREIEREIGENEGKHQRNLCFRHFSGCCDSQSLQDAI
jgi:wobble nucleotide-excising tRNase